MFDPKPFLEAAGALQTEVNRSSTYFARGLAVISAVSIVVFFATEMLFAVATFTILAAVGFRYHHLFVPKAKAFSVTIAQIREAMISQMIHSMDHPWLKFESRPAPVTEAFRQSGLAPGKFEWLHASDALSGVTKGDAAFAASFLEGGDIVISKDSEGRERRDHRLLFRGFFLIAEMPKEFSGWATLQNDLLEKLGWLATEWRLARDERYVRLDNVEFEKAFHVRASDPQTAHLLFSADTMAALSDFRRLHPQLPLSIRFENSTVMVTIPTRQNPFAWQPDPKHHGHYVQSMQKTVQQFVDLIQALPLHRSVGERAGPKEGAA